MSSMDQDMKRVQDAIDLLSEHFDAVQIMASRCDVGQEGGTFHVCMGAGNWFSLYGLARHGLPDKMGRSLIITHHLLIPDRAIK